MLPLQAIDVPSPPEERMQACVVVPARDEAGQLPQALEALATQKSACGRALAPDRYEVLLFLNNCADGSAGVAARFQRAHPDLRLHVAQSILPPEHAHVGMARRLIMDAACRRFERLRRPHGVILSTDADTRAAPDWVAATLAEVDAGADAVGGRVMLCSEERAQMPAHAVRFYLLDLGYRRLTEALTDLIDPAPFDSFPRHHQHFGASLAITARMYAQVGGLPPSPCNEDVALYEAVRRADGRFRHSLRVRAFTSARTRSHTQGGMAEALHTWSENVQEREPWVESAAAVAQRAALRRHLRAAWHQPSASSSVARTRLASCPGVPSRWLAEALQDRPATFGAFCEAILARSQQLAPEPEPICQAMRKLRLRIAQIRRARHAAVCGAFSGAQAERSAAPERPPLAQQQPALTHA